ncbi:MAG: hypothetical protein ABSD09_07160 [Xanthobacteraceae bacterium]
MVLTVEIAEFLPFQGRELIGAFAVAISGIPEAPMRCPTCNQSIDHDKAWKGTANRFYCSEFCADSENIVSLPPPRRSLREHFDRQYMQRLERLVALRKQHAA